VPDGSISLDGSHVIVDILFTRVKSTSTHVAHQTDTAIPIVLYTWRNLSCPWTNPPLEISARGGWNVSFVMGFEYWSVSSEVIISQITDYRLPIGPIKVGRPRGANLGSMGNNRRHTVISH
jgi:hypothetical protein